MDDGLRSRISAAVDGVAGDRAPAGSLAWEVFRTEAADVFDWKSMTVEGAQKLRHAVETAALGSPGLVPEHFCRWEYRGHETEETDANAASFLGGLVAAASGKHRTLVLQGCAGCGDLRITALAGKWERDALIVLNAESAAG